MRWGTKWQLDTRHINKTFTLLVLQRILPAVAIGGWWAHHCSVVQWGGGRETQRLALLYEWLLSTIAVLVTRWEMERTQLTVSNLSDNLDLGI
jgi:hypothetical protein